MTQKQLIDLCCTSAATPFCSLWLNDSLRFVYFCEDAKDVNLLIWAAMMQTQPLAISESVCDGSLTQQCVHAVVRKDSQP